MWLLGFDLNLIHVILVFFIVYMVLCNGVIQLFKESLPLAVVESFNYGKALDGPVQSSLVRVIVVPKSWFTHFYYFSSIYIPLLLSLAVSYYIFESPPSQLVIQGLDCVCTEERQSSTTPEAVVLCLTLLTVQCFKRLYECLFVNAKSNSEMNVLHYLVGFAHYFAAGTGILCEAPGFNRRPFEGENVVYSMSALVSIKNFILVLLFFTAWKQQLRVHQIFAELKARSKAQHGIPEGGLFTWVSCPHYLCEVGMYTVFMLLLGPAHLTSVLVWLWVAVNQTLAAYMSHQWYRKTFKTYPKERTAIFPFLF